VLLNEIPANFPELLRIAPLDWRRWRILALYFSENYYNYNAVTMHIESAGAVSPRCVHIVCIGFKLSHSGTQFGSLTFQRNVYKLAFVWTKFGTQEIFIRLKSGVCLPFVDTSHCICTDCRAPKLCLLFLTYTILVKTAHQCVSWLPLFPSVRVRFPYTDRGCMGLVVQTDGGWEARWPIGCNTSATNCARPLSFCSPLWWIWSCPAAHLLLRGDSHNYSRSPALDS
jgi:hypothetical protein